MALLIAKREINKLKNQHASIDKFALIPHPQFTDGKETSFLKRCRENGNLEILYRKGMLRYFSTSRANSGFEKIRKAALEGHHEAKYICSIILMAHHEDKEGRECGYDLFWELTNSTCFSIERCRKRVEAFFNLERKRITTFVLSMWEKNHKNIPIDQYYFQCATTCHSNGIEKVQNISTWPIIEDNDSCKYWDGDYELALFYNMFRRSLIER